MNYNKRFWLFTGMNYYPGGGMNDFEGSFDSLEELRLSDRFKESEACSYEWIQIWDTFENKEVE